jgi:NAD(P)-dependent dehydrogenase (short-subunit alcohol dehydrogenase family)
MGRLTGKVALVTGAASGIGHATAELFAAEGAQVIASDIQTPKSAYQSHAIQFVTHDVADESSWKTVVRDIASGYRALHVLINNAGIGGRGVKILDETLEGWNRNIAVNQTGVFLGMREVIPMMRAQKLGSIVNMSSIWGITAVAGGACYHATKGAVRILSKQAAICYAGDGIRVNSLHPGIVATASVQLQAKAISDKVIAGTPLGRMADPKEVAFGCLFLASDESSFMTGAELVIDGGYTAQ